jgi:hypothetical protein
MGSSLLLWLAAAVWVDWRSRGAAGGVHHGDGDGQAVVQEKGAALAAQPAWEKHTEEQASIMAWCAVWYGLGCRAVSECRGVGRVERVERVEVSSVPGTVDTVDTR